MKSYLVSWHINLWATSPKDAAEQALAIQRDPNSIATEFEVLGDGRGDRLISVDLYKGSEHVIEE